MDANELENEEGTSATEYALGVTLTMNDKTDILPEFRLMKDAIGEWVSKRGDSSVLIIVNVLADSDIHEIFDDLLAKVYAQTSGFALMLQSRTVQVTLLDLEGNERDQYELRLEGQVLLTLHPGGLEFEQGGHERLGRVGAAEGVADDQRHRGNAQVDDRVEEAPPLENNASRLLLPSWQEARRIFQEDQRDVVDVAEADEASGLRRRVAG